MSMLKNERAAGLVELVVLGAGLDELDELHVVDVGAVAEDDAPALGAGLDLLMP
jgi:hypothetical protein